MPSLLGANLSPEEKAHPQIDGVLRNAQSFNLTGVSREINLLTNGPTQVNCNRGDPPTANDTHTVENLGSPFEAMTSESQERSPLRLWATHYYTPVYNTETGGVPLKRRDERPIQYEGQTISLSHRRWCMAAMEGSVSIRMVDGVTKTYNYSGVGNMQTDCTSYFRGQHRATGRVKFSEVTSAWGLGVRNYSLIPYRTIAVDPNVIPYGSVVFIADAVGEEVTLADGTSFIHDGYFFAGDTGGAIRNNHIDVFTGNNSHNDLPFIRSTSSAVFDAEIVNDPVLKERLERLHRHEY